MKIANIIYEKELVNHTKVDYINYLNGLIAYEEVDRSLPTLYVGWSFMKACNPNNMLFQDADVLSKRIVTNQLYWEFDFKENKALHIKGVDKFTATAPDFYFTPQYIYTNLDPVFFQIKDVNDLMDVCPKEIDSLYNYKNEMLYFLKENKIWGIDLMMYSYFQFDINDILIKIGDRTKSAISDIDGSYHQKYHKIFPNFDHLKRYLVSI